MLKIFKLAMSNKIRASGNSICSFAFCTTKAQRESSLGVLTREGSASTGGKELELLLEGWLGLQNLYLVDLQDTGLLPVPCEAGKTCVCHAFTPLIPAPARILHLPEALFVGKNEMSRKGCFLNGQTKREDYLQELLLSHSGRTGILGGGGSA